MKKNMILVALTKYFDDKLDYMEEVKDRLLEHSEGGNDERLKHEMIDYKYHLDGLVSTYYTISRYLNNQSLPKIGSFNKKGSDKIEVKTGLSKDTRKQTIQSVFDIMRDNFNCLEREFDVLENSMMNEENKDSILCLGISDVQTFSNDFNENLDTLREIIKSNPV